MKKNLVLTGMMGVGKSTIGKKLAKRLERKFVDIYKIIEKKEKNTIKEIFENKGEHYFRKIEKKIVLEELKKNNLVIALGGGAFINGSTRNSILKNTISMWLDNNLITLNKRIKRNKNRPLLSKINNQKKIKKLYDERKNIYKLADYKIICNDLNKEDIANKIIAFYEQH